VIIVTTIQNKSLLRVNMRILITNDDGINAPGLKILTKIALQLTDKDNVVTVAPSSERSGVGHCISYTSPMMITEIEQNRFSVDGYPADCVLAGIYHVFDGKKPDLVLSGVNKGNNSAENVLYSGTIGAALEGALQGIKSIALSQYYGPQNLNLKNPFETSEI
jgi:5'-nucleotidase